MSEETKKEGDEPLTFKEALGSTPEVQEYVMRMHKERDDFMLEKLEEHLSEEDFGKFLLYKQLNEYFSGGEEKIVEFVQQRASYQDSRFGVKIYGTTYWMEEKELLGMDNEPIHRGQWVEKKKDEADD